MVESRSGQEKAQEGLELGNDFDGGVSFHMCTIWNLLGSSNSGIRLLLPRMRSHSRTLQYLAVVFGRGSSVTVL